MRFTQLIPAALISVCLAAQAWGAQDQKTQAPVARDQEPPACILGNETLAQKQPALAVIEYNKCLSKNPPTFKILSNLGIAYAQQKKFPEAIQSYGQALALDPQNANVLTNLGLAYMKTNRPKEASEQFARALLTDPGNGKTLELLAYAHLALSDYPLAGYEASIVHNASPGDPTAAYILGVAYMRMGMNVKAIPLIESSLAHAKPSGGTYMVLGEALVGIKSWEAALDAFRRAEKMDPSLPGLYADLGAALAAMAELDNAKAAFLKELARDPNNFKANYLLGQLDRAEGDKADAQKYLEKANELGSGNPGPAFELSVLAVQNEDYPKAEALLEGIVQKFPDLTDAHVLLAQVYFRLHKTEQGTRERAIAVALQRADHARLQAEGRRLKWLSSDSSAAQEPRKP